MRRIELASGQTIKVDDFDFEAVASHLWHVSHNGYAIRRVRQPGGRKRLLYLHRELLGHSGPFDVDHADGDKLNNCRSNLRPASRTLNNANSRPRQGCSSRYKGVAWVKSYGRWWAYINRAGKRIHLGYFDDEVEAAKAYNAAAPAVFGQFARVNVLP